MGLTKEEQKQLIELSARAEGMPKKEFIAALAKEQGIEPAPTTKLDANARFIETILKAGSEGKLNMKEMMDSMMSYKMMEMMMGGGISAKTDAIPAQQPNIMELIAKNDEKWERRLEAMEAKTEKEALQRQLDEMRALILSSSGNKKDELSDKFEKLNEKLDAEKEKRFADALDNKSNEIEQLKEYMQTSLDDLRNQPAPKSSDEGFFDMMQKMEKFDSMVRSRGKALGMTDEQIEREIAKEKPMKQQILSDIFKTINRGIDAYAGRKPEPADGNQPEIMESPQAVSPITCGNCGNASTNGTDWCDPCRIQYSNDVVVARQKEIAEAAQKTPTPQQTEAETRAKGEIPPNIQPEEAQQV